MYVGGRETVPGGRGTWREEGKGGRKGRKGRTQNNNMLITVFEITKLC
jgi:hypothetical protein